MMRVLIVDDEAVARERMRQLLAGVSDVEIAGEASNGEQALECVAEIRPDLILLDIQMPGASGLEVAACLPHPRPRIIFCTAFDQYAVDAFELHAVDYLLKPVNRARLAQAIARVRDQQGPQADAGIDRVAEAVHGKCTRLLARCGSRVFIIPQRDVVYYLSEAGLTRAYTHDRQYLLDQTLNELEERIDPAAFFRISRAAIVNLEQVAEVRLLVGGSAEVGLKTGVKLEVSRRRVKDLFDRLGEF